MEGTASLYIKYEIFERLNLDIHNVKRDKNFSSKFTWITGFRQNKEIVLDFVKTRKEFDLLLAGSILKADKFEADFNTTQILLPYNVIITGLMIVYEGTMDEKMLLPIVTRISKEIKKFQSHELPNPYYISFIRKLPLEYVFYSSKDMIAFRIDVTFC